MEAGPSNPKRRKLATIADDPQPQLVPRNTTAQDADSDSDSRSAHGLRKFYHGIAYQVQWNMIVALEAQQRLVESQKQEASNISKSAFTFKTKDFKTEDPNAGKFDDVAWKYEIDESERSENYMYDYNFLQAKSMLDEDKEISMNELLKSKPKKEPAKAKKGEDDRPFALEKYFLSYKNEIKENYKDGKIVHLIIATNINFNNDLKNNLFSKMEEESIPILDFIEKGIGKKSEAWELKKEGSLYGKITKHLYSTYDVTKLVNESVESVYNNKPITEESLLCSYLFDLMKKNIINESGKFSSKFLESSEELGQEAKCFYDFLRVGFGNKIVNGDRDFTMLDPKGTAELVALKIKDHKNFAVEIKRLKSVRKIIDENFDQLANYVLVEDDEKRIRFSKIFWTKDKLLGNLEEFRCELKRELDKLEIIKSHHSMSDIAKNLEKYTFKITGENPKTRKAFKTCKEILVDEEAFWKKFQIKMSEFKLIKLAVDKDALSKRNIVQNNKFCHDFIEGSSNLPAENKEFRKFLLKEGFENIRKASKNDFNNDFNINEPDKFAEAIASLIKSCAEPNYEVKIEKRKSIIANNISKLSNYVFVQTDASEVKFSYVFWEEENLPGNLENFREKLKCELVKHSIINLQDAGSDIAKKLSKYCFEIANFITCDERLVNKRTFFKALENGDIYENIVAALPFNKKLPNESVECIQSEINNFLGKLRFVVNYSQNNLDEFTKKKSKYFSGFESDYVAHEFQVKVGNALNLASGEFISDVKQVTEFFKKSTDQMNAIALIGLTLEYKAKIVQYGIEFRIELAKDLLKLEDEPGYFLDFNKRILALYSEQKDLSCIKLIQVLEADEKFQNQGSYTSLSLNSILLLKDEMLKAFNSETSNNLIIIRYEAGMSRLDDLDNEMSKVLINERKKIIFIAEKNDNLSTEFEKCFRYECAVKNDEQNSLVDLTIVSQKELLKESTLVFQGEEVTLGKLFVKEESKKQIKGEILFELLEGKRITIGSSLPTIRDPNSPAYCKMMKDIDERHLKDGKNDIFVISGISQEPLANNLGIEIDKIVMISKEIFCQENSFQFIVLGNENSDKNVNDFEEVCRQYEKSLLTEVAQEKKLVHLVEFHNGKFIWNRYYDPDFYIDRNFIKVLDEIDKSKFIDYFGRYKGAKCIFLAGTIQKVSFVKQYIIEEKMLAPTLDELEKKQPIFILSKVDEAKEAEQLFRSLDSNYNIHWIEINNNRLFWKCSKGKGKGNTSVISKLRISPTIIDRFYERRCRSNFYLSKPLTDSSDPIYKGIPESNIVNIIKTERFIVIADVPGMGKSTTLLTLSESYKKQNPLDWVIKINLRECEDSIDANLREDLMNSATIVKFISEIDTQGMRHSLAQILLTNKLGPDSDGGILLLLDGFDEIRGGIECINVRQENVVKLLTFLKKNNIGKTIIATRSYDSEKRLLENALSVLSYNFCPISNRENQHQNFIERVWLNSFRLVYSQNELNVVHLKMFVKALCDKCHEVFGEELMSFIGVPLQLQMLAETYLKNDKSFEKNQGLTDETSVKDLFKDLNISSLYTDFITSKYDIYFYEKNRFGKTVADSDKERLKKSYQKDHKRLAFEYYFAGESTKGFELFFSDNSNRTFFKSKLISNSEVPNLSRVGIVHSRESNKIDFVHRTFAEYFISELIFERFQKKLMNPNYSQNAKKKMWEFLLNNIFLQDNYIVIRNFMNSKLASHNLIVDFETNFSEFKGMVGDLLEKTVSYERGRIMDSSKIHSHLFITLPEVLAIEGLSEIVEFILKIAPSNYICKSHNIDLEMYEDSGTMPPLFWAIRGEHLGVIEVLLKCAKKIGKLQNILDAKILVNFIGVMSPVDFAALAGSFKIVQTLVDSGAKPSTSEVAIYAFGYFFKGFTPPHFALMGYESLDSSNQNEKVKILQYLLENGYDIYATEEGGHTLLHYACVGSHRNSIYCLYAEEWFPMIKENHTKFVRILRDSVSSQSLEMITEIVVLLVEKATTSESGGMSVSDYINARNKRGLTAIFLAAVSRLWSIVDYLLCKVDRITNLEQVNGITTLHYLAAEVEKDVIEIMDMFIQKSGIPINCKTTDTEETPLHWAAKNKSKKAIKFLHSKNGINVNARNIDDLTARDLCGAELYDAFLQEEPAN